ncbi:MAG: hypothetical protein H5T40_05985 [Methanobacteriales archaeon]|nr:hypothetical protein [Methanobacteriales archaeon]
MELLPHTRLKLEEAKHFYKCMKKASEDHKGNLFFFNFSAFVSAWKSIVNDKSYFLANEIYGELKKYYRKEEVKKFRDEIVKKVFNNLEKDEKEVKDVLADLRNLVVHRRFPDDLKIKVEMEDSLALKEKCTYRITFSTMFGTYEVSGNFNEEEISKQKRHLKRENDEDKVWMIFCTKDGRRNILDISKKGLNIAEKVVEECEKRLSKKTEKTFPIMD